MPWGGCPPGGTPLPIRWAKATRPSKACTPLHLGGAAGLGLGNSRQKYLYVPEPQNDFIFSILCEELGFVGAALTVVLFLLLFLRGMSIAVRARDKFGALLAVAFDGAGGAAGGAEHCRCYQHHPQHPASACRFFLPAVPV